MDTTCYVFCAFILLVTASNSLQNGIIYPQESEIRQKISLDGVWNFIKAETVERGYGNHWYEKSFIDLNETVQPMPVPSSYNDITTDSDLRDHVGIVWYERFFYVPPIWEGLQRVWLRFGSVSYAAQVWINGILVISHQIGHLPFQADITTHVQYGNENRVTVACDNILTNDTIPQGTSSVSGNGRLVQTYIFDFFNYAGIDRSVFLYTTPFSYIDDITVSTENIDNGKATLAYKIDYVKNSTGNLSCRVELIDKFGNISATNSCNKGTGELVVEKPNLWWPYLMDEKPGYLYTFTVKLLNENGKLIDIYRQKIGIRKLTWNDKIFQINEKPLYLHGFGKHEDSDIRGKGLDLPLIIRDYNLIKWIGANAYRTSHYPYAEEIMDLADSMGIMIIDESPAIKINYFGDKLLENHKKSLSELIKRDKNRPSVIIWSAANEPRSQYPAAHPYFKKIMEHIKKLDTTRPTTIVENQSTSNLSMFVDIICFSRYNGWYDLTAGIKSSVISEAIDWNQRFNKLVIMQEYGGDALVGLHTEPNSMWTEEYQVDLMSKHFKAFDYLRAQNFFIGEFIWNFADFNTAESFLRPGASKKGIFTRNRQPKAGAHFLRKRYWNLAKVLYNRTLPEDLYEYVISTEENVIHDEL